MGLNRPDRFISAVRGWGSRELGYRDRVTDRFRSHWQTSAAPTSYPPLTEARTCDVVVIGAGIVGVSAALELRLAGADVVLLEARRIGAGASGYTTGKISALNGLIYA